MPTSIPDLRAKMVLDDIIDLDTRSAYLSDLWSDVGDALGKGQSIDIGEIGDLTVQDAVDTNQANQNLTVQSISNVANNLIIDQAKAISAELPDFDQIFSLNGRWVERVARQIQTKIRNNRDTQDYAYLATQIGYETTGTVAGLQYHFNVAGGSATVNAIETTIANATRERTNNNGAPYDQLVWMFHPFGIGSVRLLPSWQNNEATMGEPATLGVRKVGFLCDIPVYVSPSVLRNQSVAVAAGGVSITANVATATLPANHGFVVGMPIVLSGFAQAQDNGATILTSAATTVTFALTRANGVLGGGPGTLNDTLAWNALVRRDWLWQSTAASWPLRIIPYGPTRTSDVLQAKKIWGRRSRAAAAFFMHTPGSAV